MKFWLMLSGLLLVLLLPSAHAVDRAAFTFTHYDLNVHVHPLEGRLAIDGEITLRNDSLDPERFTTLQISSTLKWTSIQMDGKPVEFLSQSYTSDIDHTGSVTEAVVTLPTPVAPQHSVELHVVYEGTIQADSSRLTRIGVPKSTAEHSDWDQIESTFTAVRGIGYVAWYPVSVEAQSISDGNSLFQAIGYWRQREADASMRVNLCAEGLPSATLPSLLINGEPTGNRRIGGNDKTAFACSEFQFSPLRMRVPLFAIIPYDVLERPIIRVYYSGSHKPAAEDYAVAAEKLLPLSTPWFGAPKSAITVVETPNVADQPYESGEILFTPLSASQPQAAELTMAHQLIHASFRSDRQWIEEGLAHFGQALEHERQDGRQAALDFMSAQLPALVEAERVAVPEKGKTTADQLQPLVTATDDIFFRTKAMYVWWMLRDMIGDTALQRALANYRLEADKEPSYMQRLLEAQTHRSLETFFDDWVYRDRGLPEFHIKSAYPRAVLGGGYMVTVTIENKGAAEAEVPVIVWAEHGEVSQQVLVPGRGSAVARIEVPATPTEIVVNDGSIPTVGPPAKLNIKLAKAR